MSSLSNFVIPSSSQILNQLLLDYQAQAAANGFTVAINPGSEIYIRFSSLANQLAVQNNIYLQSLNASMVDASTGSDLDRLALQFGLVRRGATSAQGFFSLISAAPQTLTTTMTLSGTNGLLYQVSQNGIYQPQGPNQPGYVPVVSVDTGSQTNLSVGTILNWVTLPPNTQSTAPVAIAITGGTDQEDDATLRARLINVLQNPAGAGNAAQLVRIAQSVDPLVQGAFVYSNYNGAGTQLIALTSYQTTSYIGRDLPHVATDNSQSLQLLSPPYNINTLPNTNYPVTPPNNQAINIGQNLANDTSSIFGQIAASFANPYATAVTTVNNAPVNIALSVSLPYPVGAPTNGTGGGWLDFTTFPNPDGKWIGANGSTGYVVPQIVSVTGLVSSTATTPAGFQITIAAATGNITPSDGYCTKPTAGITHISWINRSDALETGWIPVTATILYALSNNNNTWTLILDTPLTFADGYDFYGNSGPVAGPVPGSVGDYIFPASTNISAYLSNVLTSFAQLGPGQVTTTQGLLALGAARVPSPTSTYASIIGPQFLQNITANNNEVFDAAFYYNGATDSSNIYYNSGSPGNPAAGAPPAIWIPYQLGFYDPNGSNYL